MREKTKRQRHDTMIDDSASRNSIALLVRSSVGWTGWRDLHWRFWKYRKWISMRHFDSTLSYSRVLNFWCELFWQLLISWEFPIRITLRSSAASIKIFISLLVFTLRFCFCALAWSDGTFFCSPSSRTTKLRSDLLPSANAKVFWRHRQSAYGLRMLRRVDYGLEVVPLL